MISSTYLVEKAIIFLIRQTVLTCINITLLWKMVQSEHFWSEKLADCYLGEAYPIHIGCTNLHDYFPQQAYTSIPGISPISRRLSRKIKEVIASDLWHRNRAHILEAKRRIMEEYQLLPMIDRIVHQAPQSHEQLLTPVSLQNG